MGQKAFVTGASGFVGMNLVTQLAQEGWEVHALVRNTSPLEDIEHLGITLAHGDITDANSVLAAMPEEPDAVFHVAASTSIWSGNNDAQRAINVDGTRHVIDACLAKNAKRLIHTSSFVVWGFQPSMITEDTPRLDNADWINYARTKFEAEELVRDAIGQNGLDAVIMNPAHILGPGDRHNWSRAFRLVHQRKLPGMPPGGGAFADVREVAKAHIRAVQDGRSGHNYLLGGHDVMFPDIIRYAGEILDRKVPRKPSPAWLLRFAGKIFAMRASITGNEPDVTPEGAALITRHIQCDSSRAQAELGYQFTPARTLVADTIEWMRNKNLLD